MGGRVAIVFFLCIGSSVAVAEQSARKRLLKSPEAAAQQVPLTHVLVEVDRQKEVLAKLKTKELMEPVGFLPKRVYLHKDEADGNWYYVLTNFEAKYPESTHEYIRAGSVLEGKLLGAKAVSQRYLLNRQGLWVPTYRAESLAQWLTETPRPRIKFTELGSANPRKEGKK